MRKSIVLILTIGIIASASGNIKLSNVKNEIVPPALSFNIEIDREEPFRGSININDAEYPFDLRDSDAYNVFKEGARLWGKFIPGGIN